MSDADDQQVPETEQDGQVAADQPQTAADASTGDEPGAIDDAAGAGPSSAGWLEAQGDEPLPGTMLEAGTASPAAAAAVADDADAADTDNADDAAGADKAAAAAAVADDAYNADNADAAADSAHDAADETAMPRRGSAELKAIVEALIFASPDPLTFKAMAKLLSSEPKEDVQEAIAELKQDYERPGGLQLVEVAGGYQIVTRSDLHEWVRQLFHERSTQKLSVQALETLAVVAYRQPVTALEITEIRGVNTSGVMNTLLERHLIKIVGRKQVVGRPFMYATTKEFLIRFGLNDLTDLPKVEDMAEALGIESPLLVERVPLEEQLPLEEPLDGPELDVADDDPSSSNGSVH